MKLTVLSVEQMKHLEELGLDTRDASMFWWNNSLMTVSEGTPDIMDDFPKSTCYAYTLQDILEKLPIELPIKSKQGFNYMLEVSRGLVCWNVAYIDYFDTDKGLVGIEMLGHQREESLLEASYQMLLWCIEKGYIKTNKV